MIDYRAFYDTVIFLDSEPDNLWAIFFCNFQAIFIAIILSKWCWQVLSEMEGQRIMKMQKYEK